MKTLIFSILMLVCPVLIAAGGGSMGGGVSMEPRERKTPRQLAVENYQRGIAYRDKAWAYEAEAGRESSGKKIAKLNKKALKQYGKAVRKFTAAIKQVPAFYQAHGSLGYALRKTGDYEASLAAYDKALQLKPDYTEAIEYRAEAYLNLGRLDETREAYIRLMGIDRARADELMDAIRAWLNKPDKPVSPDELVAFESWVSGRVALAEQTLDLSRAGPKSWSPE